MFRAQENSSQQRHFEVQKFYEKQTSKLREELKEANQIIEKLRFEIQSLKTQLKHLHTTNQRLLQKIASFELTEVTVKSFNFKQDESINVKKDFQGQMEAFSSSSKSQSSIQQYPRLKSNVSLQRLKRGEKSGNAYLQSNEKTKQNCTSSLTLNKQIKPSGKVSLLKIMRADSSEDAYQPITAFDTHQFPNIALPTAEVLSPKNNRVAKKIVYFAKSQREITPKQIGFTIKQRPKLASNPLKAFKKVFIEKPIYEIFFVTGLNQRNEPKIIYSYPKKSQHFGPILSICYSDDFLRPKDNLSSSFKSLPNSFQGNIGKIKDFYVVPLRKLQTNAQNHRQYLAVCEVEEIVLIQKEKSFAPYIFQRLYCFISSCQIFSTFKNLTNQFLQKINSIKNKECHSYLSQQKYKKLLEQVVEQPLMVLSQKSVQLNHSLVYRLDPSILISIDFPSVDNSYKLISQYNPWGIINFKVQVRSSQQQSSIQTKLFGILLIYILSEKKVILFSTIKSKISQIILHFLQIIKPLQYVFPIIMAALKQQHQEYLTAPMSLILGLWVEQKKLQRQKIQIFMNRKENLAGIIEKGKLQIQDGIVINLDTGFIYGEGLSKNLTSIGLLFNDYYQNYCHYPKDMFKLFQKLFSNQIHNNQSELFHLYQKLTSILDGTQIFTYFKEKIIRKKTLIH